MDKPTIETSALEVNDVSPLEVEDRVQEEECLNFIYQENDIPTFKFEKTSKRQFSKSYLVDTLFTGFSESSITTKSGRNYIEFRAWTNIPSKKNPNFRVNNSYSFFKYSNDTYGLADVHINFPANSYKNLDKELYEIIKDSSRIDVGLSKQLFAQIFRTDAKLVCDTVQVSNDSSDSWYLFKNNRLHKIIMTLYTD